MKTKELTLTAMFIAVLIVQNYVLFSFPITLTYTIFYFLTKKLNSKQLPYLAVFVFVIIKNIIMPALLPVIILDTIGLLIFVLVCKTRNKLLTYILIPFTIIVHLLLLDFGHVFLTLNFLSEISQIFKLWFTTIASSFVAYIYAPLSIILILMIDGIEYISDYSLED